MSGETPDFDFGVEFPKARSSSRKKSSRPKKKRATKLSAIPKGVNYLHEIREITIGRMKRAVHDFMCPSPSCNYAVRGSFNMDAGRRTLETHIHLDHRKRK